MKKRNLMFIVCLTVTASTMCSCRIMRFPGPDAVTEATRSWEQKKVTQPPPSDTYNVLGNLDGLKNYVVKYDERFYRGGEPNSAKAAEQLKKLGIATIVSVTPSDAEREFCSENGFVLVEIPFEKTNGPALADLQKFVETIQAGEGPFYTHCHGGSHRGGTLGLAYRMHVLGWPYEKAVIEFGRLGGSLKDDHVMIEAVRDFKP